MALNKFMHPRNKYRVPPDFKELAVKYPEFRKHVVQDLSGKVHLDFKDVDSLRALTVTLLKHDFGLDLVIPPNHLVPTLPQRLNYILWLEDLLTLLPHSNGVTQGIDIGTGASCIYPLLGSKNKWKFLATEVNQESVVSAEDNVKRNHLCREIEVLKVDPSSTLETILEGRNNNYDFCMCNPPFFRDRDDINWRKHSRTSKRAEPSAVKTGLDEEMAVEGGEVEFVKTIIRSSVNLGEKVKIYTTMLGKKMSVKPITEELINCKISCFTTTEFCQGKTMRWGVAWTFVEGIDLKKTYQKPKVKPPLVYIIPSNISETAYDLNSVEGKVLTLLQDLQVEVKVVSENKKAKHMHLRSNQNTWSHQRRKRREIRRQRLTSPSTTIQSAEESSDAKVKQNSHDVTSLPSTSASCEENSLQKRKLEDNADYPSAKHPRSRDAMNNKTEKWLLSCDLVLKQIGKNVALELQCCNDMEARDPMHQILQFLKNNIK